MFVDDLLSHPLATPDAITHPNNDVSASIPLAVFFPPLLSFSSHLRPRLYHTDLNPPSSLHSNPRPIYMNSVTADALLALYVGA